MSISVMTAVWERPKQEGGALLLMLAIADRANDSGLAFPSIKRLARKARLTERQIYRLVQQLLGSGEIEIEHGGGRHCSNLYKINLAALEMGAAEKQPPEQRPKKVSRGNAGKRNPKTPFPDDFALTAEMRKKATDKGCENPDRAFEAFRDKSLANGYTYANWTHAFYSWGWRADAEPRNGSRPAPPPRKVQSHAEMLKARSLT